MKRRCDGCFDEFEEDFLSDVTMSGGDMKFCPRCVFIVALYHEEGIEKEWQAGQIHPDKISNRVRKIVVNEFYEHPKETYEKYLGNMIHRQEVKALIIRVSDKEIDRLANFPFLFLEPEKAKEYKLENGVNITLKSEKQNVTRNLYGFKTIEAKYLKKYGRKQTSTVLFLPA